MRCAQCGNAWHATKADELKPKSRPAAAVKPAAAPKPASAPAFAAPAAEVDAGTAAQAAALRRSVGAEEISPQAAEADEDLFDEGMGGEQHAEPAEDYSEGEDFGVADSLTDEFGEDFDADEPEAGVDANDDEDFDDYDDDDILARRRGDLRREAERKSRALKQKLLAFGWAALLVFVIGVLGALFFMKETVTSTFPGTNQLYDFFADSQADAYYKPDTEEPLTTPITETEVYVKAGLFEDQLRYETVDGQNMLVIVGQLENVGQRAANVPKVEISIIGSSGRVLDKWIYDPPGLVLRRLSKLQFETRRPAPLGARSVEIRPLEGTRSENRAPSQL